MGCLSSWAVSTFTHHALKAWCAHKLGRNKYKYLILGDDNLDSDKDIYDVYIDAVKRLGVSISLSKCSLSESANAEFAKRFFTPEGEITGLPVDLLMELDNKPEQFVELVRIARERGYTEDGLKPGISVLISCNRSHKVLADVLALPEVLSGIPPLLEAKPGSHAEALLQSEEGSINKLVAIARESEFIELVQELEKAPSHSSHVGKLKVNIPENHPIVFALSEKLMSYLETGSDDEYSIYKS